MRGNNELIQSRPSWSCKTVRGFLYILLYCYAIWSIWPRKPKYSGEFMVVFLAVVQLEHLHYILEASAYKQLLAYYLAWSIVAQVIHSCHIPCTMIHSCTVIHFCTVIHSSTLATFLGRTPNHRWMHLMSLI